MSLSPGSRLGPYEITAPVGAGGMGEVYRARDMKLGRDVAIKVLPEAFLQDNDRLARFEREARLLASLNHPNIAAIYELEESDGTSFLVLEFVPGETLAERISRAPIPTDEALIFFKQIAEALEAAHDNGIIHRDLKPANIKVTPEGKVKVLDFGLAKALVSEPADQVLSESPTFTKDATKTGVLLGTAPYMSPEQARGKAVDKRADIWAFGCCLYEALTGKAVFLGETVSDTIASILKQPPDWDRLPRTVPRSLHRLLRRCLHKDPNQRLKDAGDARLEIEEASTESTAATETIAPTKRGQILPWAAAAVMAILAAAVVLWSLSRPPSQGLSAMRLILPLTEKPFIEGAGASSFAFSPDGARLAYASISGDRQQLFIHEMDQLEGRPIPGTEDGQSPFFSHDGQWLGFFADGKMKKVNLSGGEPQILCDAPIPTGAAWGSDDTIVFAPLDGSHLMQVSADGSELKPFTTINSDERENWHRWPEFLPDGKTVIFSTVNIASSDAIVARSLETGERRILIDGGRQAHYLQSGHIAYVHNGALVIAPFDPMRLEFKGDPIPIAEGVQRSSSGAYQYAFSPLGWLVYVSGRASPDPPKLAWVDRSGEPEIIPAPERTYGNLRLSPDGQRIAIIVEDDIWVHDLSRDILTRVTFEGTNWVPLWTPDAERLVFASSRDGRVNLYWKRSDGSGETERLTTSERVHISNDWSPDGKKLIFTERNPTTGRNLMILHVNDDKRIETLLQTPYNEGAAKFSPDGRWVAHVSDETGRPEIYVRPYPGPGSKWRISGDGGTEVMWSRDGREIFYRDGYKMYAVDIDTRSAFRPGKPRLLFERRYGKGLWAANYDVAPDGRFIMRLESEGGSAEPQVNVIVNWLNLLDSAN